MIIDNKKIKSSEINKMFTTIAKHYDYTNHVLSAGLDFYWKKCLVRAVCAVRPKTIVDLATGSGDIAFAVYEKLNSNAIVTGIDFCKEMLNIAKKKSVKQKKNIKFIEGDCLKLPLRDNSVDALTISFGLRNLENRIKGLKEMHRVLKSNGSLFILEFTQPNLLLKPFYFFYLEIILPKIASYFNFNHSAYQYLGASIKQFPSKKSLSDEIKEANFKYVAVKGLTGSITAIHHARIE